ncbi:hypothetical protein P691DRAFT_547705 [Macrolepiota fuliginosa MF-IS2]|uniref:Extracellular membrane protein CFEM domain-containing protein n=1 Tax=Macrolepiota fuliginosa MF-IS2 TaxID=1400762 RepID=A0A9P5XG19_9AGAR|nr:hypothetical protein P691DRAFT_547705 [Macrolepiota fuliginosa MF-IS2]
MFSSSRLFLVFLGLAHLVAANSLLGLTQPNNAFDRTALSRVVGRQSQVPSVPTQCKADCDPINSQVAQGCSPADCCKATFVTGYFNCLKCVGGALNITDYTPAQAILDQLTEACDAKGLNVPTLTLPGIDPNRPLPSQGTVTPVGGPGPASVPQNTVTPIGSSGPASIPPPGTITINSSGPANLPPPTAASQLTVTTPLSPSNPQPAPVATTSGAPTTSTPSSAIADRFLAPHFSHMSASVALFVGLVYYIV